MPSETPRQRRYMGAAYGRAKAGHPRASDPHMPIKKLREFARGTHHTPGNGTGLDAARVPSADALTFVDYE